MVFQPIGRITLRRVVWVAWLVMALTACGGGGGSNPGPPANNSNWDTLVWDQNQWQ